MEHRLTHRRKWLIWLEPLGLMLLLGAALYACVSLATPTGDGGEVCAETGVADSANYDC